MCYLSHRADANDVQHPSATYAGRTSIIRSLTPTCTPFNGYRVQLLNITTFSTKKLYGKL